VVIEGGTTNQGFLLTLLDRPELRSGDVDTTWLDRMQLHGDHVAVRHADVAVLQAAIEISEGETAADRARFYAFARRGRPQANAGTERVVELRQGGHAYRCTVSQIARERHRVTVDGTSLEVGARRVSAYERRLEVAGATYRTLISAQGADLLVEVDGVPHRIGRDDGGMVRSLAPAVVVSIPVAPGDEVQAGDVVAVVESMKMETSLVAPFGGRVRHVLTGPNVHVAAHAPLLQLEPLDGASSGTAAAGERIAFTAWLAAPPGTRERRRENLERLECAVLGYDIGAAEVDRVVAELRGGDADPVLVAGEHRLLGRFADLHALTRPRRDDHEDGEVGRSPEEHLHAFLRSLDAKAEGLPQRYAEQLLRALRHYGIESLDRTPALEQACYRLFLAQQRADTAQGVVLALLDRRLEQVDPLAAPAGPDLRAALDRLSEATDGRDPVVADLARQVRFAYFDGPVIEAARAEVYAAADADLRLLAQDAERPDRDARIDALVGCPQPLAPTLLRRMPDAGAAERRALLETIARRFYRVRTLEPFAETTAAGYPLLTARYRHEGPPRNLATTFVELEELPAVARAVAAWAATLPAGELAVADFYARAGIAVSPAELAKRVSALLENAELPPNLHRIVVGATAPGGGRELSATTVVTFRPRDGVLFEDIVLRGLHPMMSNRLHLARLSEFALDRLPAAEDVYLFHGIARSNPKDERLFALAEVRDLTPLRDADGRVAALPELERMLVQALEAIRGFQAHRKPSRRLQWNRILLHVWPTTDLTLEEIRAIGVRLAPATAGLGVEMVILHGRMRGAGGKEHERVLRLFTPAGQGVVVEMDAPPRAPLRPLDEGAQRIVMARRRGLLHPAEIVKLMAPAGGEAPSPGQPAGTFVEHELGDEGRLVPVDRPAATNPTGIVVGVLRNFTARHPEGMLRVTLMGDPTRALGALAEPECLRIIAALDLAEELGVPLEWFALSSGARIAMDSGTENMDWIAAVLRRIIEFTQAGGEINVVVAGINVGAQPYWNAEATMLMHTKGILVMTPASAMVLTGKLSLDYSGGVSADDNFGIGGYDRIMGPNGQAQYWAPDLAAACRILLAHYEHAYVAPGERFPRRAHTDDPVDRDVRTAPHTAPDSDLALVGDVLSDVSNPGRKKPFDIRSVLAAVIDADHRPLERWAGMHDAEVGIVWDAHLGGWPVAVIGIESHSLPRHGVIPADGPEQWTSGTLFPRASKKIARAINAASGRRPLVVLANLAGFDGSPESMREWQLEYGAEIGRAVVNFDGPIVFCVVSRYHGGAFVVFSQRLNEGLEAVALEGAHASVIGGAPAAAVVFAREVEQTARADPRIVALDARIEGAEGADRQRLRAERAEQWDAVLSATRGEFATEFDRVHSVERAVSVGSIGRIVTPATLRPFLVEAVERGMRRTLEREGSGNGRAVLAHPLQR
jgi:acetyl-CoA carboxylase carboxyltransferase component/biotin carboxyl carrier protein